MKKHRIAPEVKEQIINRIKNDGVTVVAAAKDHGVSEATIYGWIAKKTEGQPTLSEIIRLKRENTHLLALVGEITLKLSESQKKEVSRGGTPKTLLAQELGVSRRSLYYVATKPDRDWHLKCRIEEVLREHPSYGSRRLAIHLNRNRKSVKRVMNLFGIKAYRRRGRKWKRTKNIKVIYPNLLMTTSPQYEHHIWATDFTYLSFQGRFVYVATVLDLYTRKVVGLSVYTTHATQLVLSAFLNALNHHPRPHLFHSDNGSEYNSEIFTQALETVGTLISRSAPGCPWENGYQESFYSQFKIDLGDPSRFATLGELVLAVYQTIWQYNHTRIHSALKMPPVQFARQAATGYNSEDKVRVQ